MTKPTRPKKKHLILGSSGIWLAAYIAFIYLMQGWRLWGPTPQLRILPDLILLGFAWIFFLTAATVTMVHFFTEPESEIKKEQSWEEISETQERAGEHYLLPQELAVASTQETAVNYTGSAEELTTQLQQNTIHDIAN
jgi:hypothetical protein